MPHTMSPPPFSAPSLDVDQVLLKTISDQLMRIEQTVKPAQHTAQGVLGYLSEQLLGMYAKGFTFEQIASFMAQCNVELDALTLKAHFGQLWANRLATCEQKLASYQMQGWNAANERTAFIERGLRQALKDGNGLILHYQPQVDMHSGKVVGAEALVRWMCKGTLMSPAEFIPVAEATGLITDVGLWVLREACNEAKRWQQLGLGDGEGLKIGVNLSVKQLSDSLPDMVHDVLCNSGLPTRLLGLEITESFLADKHSLDLLQTLRDSGIHLSIDDFGTGYSCLSQLNKLPLDTIKIDRSFVVGLVQNGEPAPVVEAIINLAHKLDMNTLAEGVETHQQARALMDMGCSMCQGFLYSKALPSADFVQFVAPHH